MNNGDRVIVGTGAVVGATGGYVERENHVYGITGPGSVESVGSVVVQGTVFGTHAGINLWAMSGTFSVNVAAGGSVFSDTGPAVQLGGSLLFLENNGLIHTMGAQPAVVLFAPWPNGQQIQVLNTGTISSHGGIATLDFSISLSSSVTNSGTISSLGGAPTALSLTGRNDVVWNTGTIIGDVLMGNGPDLYQGSGRVAGLIRGMGGNDTIQGGGFNDNIEDNTGANWLAGGDGADRIRIGNTATDGVVDRIFGGVMGGTDTSTNDTLLFKTEDGSGGVNVFLSGGFVTSATNALIAVMTGIENAEGTSAVDALIGSNAANVLTGGAGGDWIVGNGGADTFVFLSFGDAGGDQIRDFRRSEGDRIDLSEINATFGFDDTAFAFRTTRTANASGEAVVTNFGNSARVDLYSDSDAVVDGSFIVVYGEAGVTSLQATDFLL